METAWTITNEQPGREHPMAADLVIGYSAAPQTAQADPFTIRIETVEVAALRLLDWDGVPIEEFARRNGTLSAASAAVLAARFAARLERDEPLRAQLQQWCRRQCPPQP